MKEVWKDIVGYEGFYQVSNKGRVKSLKRADSCNHSWPEKILKPSKTPRGYFHVHLSKNGIAKWVMVHRLVALAFVEGRTQERNIINHIDCDPSNNAASNLEWTDYKGNMQYAASLGRMKWQPQNLNKAQTKRKIPVIAIAPDGTRTLFDSQAEAARVLNITRGHIAACCRKEYGYKSIGGYAFEYADEERQKKASPNKKAMADDERIEALRKRMLGNKINAGKTLSEETKRKISQSLSRPVAQYDSNGVKIAEYSNASEATQKTGISHIDDVASGRRTRAGGYYWRWLT